MMKEVFLVMGLTVMMTKEKKLNKWWGFMFLCMWFIMMVVKYPLSEKYKILSSWVVVDSLSLLLILLSIYLTIMMYLSSSTIYKMKYYSVKYNMMLIFLLMMLYLSFMSSSYLLFYFMFEASLLPTLFIILGWGYQPERLQAGVYFMVYTLMVSLPLFMILVYMEMQGTSGEMWDFLYLGYFSTFGMGKDILFMVFMVLAFLVKLPMFLMHLWLPSAHVEAPVAGSMILAGVLLKLGGYGLSRIFLKYSALMYSLNYIVMSLSLLGMTFIGVNCCRLNDMKSLVAYSSVAHMGLVVCGLFSNSVWGVLGAVVLMVSHGLGSSGLFCFVNLIYERTGSRSVYLNKGMIVYAPLFSLFMFFLCCSNISAPPSVNFLSEVLLMIGLLSFDKFFMMVFPLGSFLGVVFTFYLYSYTQHGKLYNNLSGLYGANFMDYHLMYLHILPINFLILVPSLFI